MREGRFCVLLCKHEPVKLLHFDAKIFVLDRDSPYFQREMLDDFEEDGRIVWFEDTRDFSVGGSYED